MCSFRFGFLKWENRSLYVVLCGPFSRLFLMVVGRALACVCFGSFGRVVVSCQWPPAQSHHIVFQANTMVRGGVLLLFASLKAFGLYHTAAPPRAFPHPQKKVCRRRRHKSRASTSFRHYTHGIAHSSVVVVVVLNHSPVRSSSLRRRLLEALGPRLPPAVDHTYTSNRPKKKISLYE